MKHLSLLLNIVTLCIFLISCSITSNHKGKLNDIHSKSPDEYITKFIKDEEVIWLGEVVSAHLSQNDKNEPMIEWLCRYYDLVDTTSVASYFNTTTNNQPKPEIVARRNTKEQYFVTTLSSPDMPLETARQLIPRIKEQKRYALRRARTIFLGSFEGKTAVFIGGGDGFIGKNINVTFID